MPKLIPGKVFIASCIGFLIISCNQYPFENKKYQKKTDNTEVILATPKGDIRFLLYNKTPIHKEHFIKLIQSGLLTKSKLHLIIPDYTIQCGYEYKKKKMIRNNDLQRFTGKKIPPEIFPEFIHKRGTLAASRLPNESNPEKYSDPFQFYIVLGSLQTDFNLDLVEKKTNQQLFYEKFIRTHPYRVDTVKNPTEENLKKYKNEYDGEYRREFLKFKEEFHYTQEQRTIYNTVGGLPKLDGSYTIFGELLEGADVLDSLCTVQKDEEHKPVEEMQVNWILIE
ncbi:MAG: hypothetical protein A3H98_12910 [Bacteroidetes bacterium RIFCSPLOWO2_02_FULL_36_8]|nr:MAG: hypothetical protein A3H98_12910 [Bacteroidetes bacterium RIFCSPLOWO2_02_FULL_36_8]OFY70636.1 MAG: hypothetical protein A3G23_07865 [Bacteroidetes bacterium RIFCSPLOWO2_12_FULL_37_12]